MAEELPSAYAREVGLESSVRHRPDAEMEKQKWLMEHAAQELSIEKASAARPKTLTLKANAVEQ
jgi:hypothetical protein